MTRGSVAALKVSLAFGLASAPACLGPGDFRCATYAACGPSGFCEADGRCSRTDAACPSHRRYVHAAGAEADRCVSASCADDPLLALAAGGSHACVLRTDGGVTCWGRNDDGQLGDGTRTPRSLGVRVEGLPSAIAVAAGARHTCVVEEGGAVACWGADDTGQLGDGGGPDRSSPSEILGVENAAAIVAGDGFSCALLTGGSVTCWGDDSSGAIGDGTPNATPLPPTPVVGLPPVSALYAHWEHACAVAADDGTLWCWGENASGQLGDGTLTARASPVQVPGLTQVTAVGTGLAHTCAAATGGLYCWGSDSLGQLGSGDGIGSTAAVTVPALVPIVTDPIAIDAGAQHSCAIRASGQVLCWGQNSTGQLGEGSMSSLAEPVPVTGLDDGARVATGATYSCAEARDGAVFCWGDNHFGQLATGNGVVEPAPTAVAGLGGAKSAEPAIGEPILAVGGAHACAATRATPGALASTLFCWGSDQAGQLGDNDTTDRSTPAKIEVPLQPLGLAAGGQHTCAIDSTAGLWCWGRGSSGQLGLGPARLIDTPLPTAVKLPAAGSVVSVAAGDAHTCVLVSPSGGAGSSHPDGGTPADGGAPADGGTPAEGGDIVCFGDDSHGQLGDGATTSQSTAVPATLGAGGSGGRAIAIAAGGDHTCALDGAGDLWCWGRGDRGEIGDGAAIDRPTPTPVPAGSSSGWSAVALGASHTCALDGERRVFCWGANDRGQLATGAVGGGEAAPTRVALGPARSLTAGTNHTCAGLVDGTVACWGANESGQLGDGTTIDRPLPVAVPGAQGEVVAGGTTTCAFDAAGALTCWGADTSGQLGDGVELTVSAPEIARLGCD